MDCAADQQQLFGQRGLAGVRMRDDGKRTPGADGARVRFWGARNCDSRFRHRTLAYPLKRKPVFSGRSTLCRSEEHTSELQSLMRISYAVFCLKKKTTHYHTNLMT